MADGNVIIDTKLNTSAFEKGLSGLKNAANAGLSAVTKSISAVAVGMGGLAATAVKVGADFDSQMSKVSAISGATGTEFDSLREKAIEMGDKTMFSATESAQAFEYMAMAGWKTTDMMNGIEGIMNLAAASGEDLATTSDIVTDALTAFGLSAADSTHFADVLAQASSNANTDVSMMGDTFKYVAPLAGSLGFSAEDTAVAIGLMANSGIKASQAGTSLRSILTRMAKPTDEVQAAMDALGLSITNSDGSMKSLNEIMIDLRGAFAGLSEAEKAQMAASIGGQEAMSGLLAIVNSSDSDFDKLTDSIAGCDGASARMAETMSDNLSGQIKILQSNLQTLAIRFSDSVQGPLTDVVKQAQEAVKGLTKAFTDGGIEGLSAEIGKVLVDVLQLILGYVPTMLDTGVQCIQSFLAGITENQDALTETALSIGTSLITGILTVIPSIVDSGIQLITSLITGLTDTLPSLEESASDCVTSIAKSFAENGPALMQAGSTLLVSLIDGIISAFPTMLQTSGDILLSLTEGIAAALPTIVQAGGEILLSLLTGLTDALPDLAQGGINIINGLTEAIRTNLPDLIPAAMEALVSFSGFLRENVGQIVDAGLELIKTLAQALIDNIPVFIETIPTIITNLAGIINDNAPKLLTTGIELLAQLALGLIKAIPTLVANIPKILLAIVSVIMAFDWLNLGGKIISGIGNGLKAAGGGLKDAMANGFSGALKFIKDLPGKALQWGKDMIGNFIDGISAKARELLNGVQGLADGIRSFLHFSVPDKGPLSDADTYMPDMIKLFSKGIDSSAPVAIKSLNAMASAMADTAKKIKLPDFDDDPPSWDIDPPDFDGIDFPSMVRRVKAVVSTTIQGTATAIVDESAANVASGNNYTITYAPVQKCDEPISARKMDSMNRANAKRLGGIIANA